MKTSGLYIHIPFCDHKCIYCDFYSITNYQHEQAYLAALEQEVRHYAQQFAESHHFDSIFFGGGTPSFMSPEYIGQIIQLLQKNFNVCNDAEITLETNPGTVDATKISGFLQHGINRFSVGVQSFDAEDLKFLTRIHDAAQAMQTVHAIVDAGCKNVSLDLIFNLPGQTHEKWMHNLETAMKLPITHLSAYSLILEKGTILNRMVLDGKVSIAGEEQDAELYAETIAYMEAKGMQQYEVSNFCQTGYECRHNLHYWQYDDYLSFGTSAHSFMGGKRWWNISSLTLYLESMKHKGHATAGFELLNGEQMLEEYVMLGLRSTGIDREQINKRFNSDWMNRNEAYLQTLVSSGHARFAGGIYRLTANGYAVCDELLLHCD